MSLGIVLKVVRPKGALSRHILAAAPFFSGAACVARTGVSHGAADKGITTAIRHWFGEVLLWVMRVPCSNGSGPNTS
ncbi:hypothetical protein [Streptomyces luteogriseus]|uniref:hypothetical protein n=1 Tax=Streptomyces luteogriseus TaxID=68233 RepID=UPI0038044E21